MAQNTKSSKSNKKSAASTKTTKSKAASSASKTRKKTAGTGSAAKQKTAAARKTGGKTTVQAQPKTKVLSGEVQGIMLIALGVFFAFAFFFNTTGIVGGFIRNVCYGLFGMASAIFFLYFVIVGINCFVDKKVGDSLYKWWTLLGLMICTAMIYALAFGDTEFISGGFSANLTALYERGIDGTGGGIIGGLFCKVVVMLIGPMGTWVFTVAAVLALVIILTGISIEGIFRKIMNFFRRSRDSIKQQANREVEIDPIEQFDNEEYEEDYDDNSDVIDKTKRNKQKKQSIFRRIAAKLVGNREDEVQNPGDDSYAEAVDFDTLPHTTEVKKISRAGKRDIPETPTKPQRFVFTADDSVLDDVIGGSAGSDDNNANNAFKKFSFDDLPFDLDNITGGTISEVTGEKLEDFDVFSDDFGNENTDSGIANNPVVLFEKDKSKEDKKDKSVKADIDNNKAETGTGVFDEVDVPDFLDTTKTGALTKKPNDDWTIPEDPDPDFFEPPSEAKMQDRLDPATKKALSRGVPLDEAITRGRKMKAEEGLSPEELIEEQVSEHNAAPKLIRYRLPDINLLSAPKPTKKSKAEIRQELEDKANRLLDTLRSFKVEAKIINITQGPSVTRFELQPGVGVKVSKITGLSDDIALSLAAPGVRIEAPIPGKSAIGIEIPNVNPTPVPIREVLDTAEFRNKKSKTTVALGKDISGNCVVADIADFPHILIAGATGSGKSVCINSLITSILYKAKPDEVKMIMVDPKMVELGVYNGIPHLLIPVVTDPKHAAGALNWAVVEMQNRYNLLKDNKVRNLDGYNKLMEERGEPDAKLPEIVIIIDELADLMTVAKSEVEEAINRLAALARAAGMYLVIATQRPSVNVITGVIKANIPSRIAFAVSSQIDSRTIIDSAGAEKLLGKGDMLYSPRGSMKPTRVQGNFVSDSEIETIVDYIKSQYEAEYDEEVIEHIEKEHERVSADLEMASSSSSNHASSGSSGRTDDMFLEAVELVLENGQASVAMFQRKFKMGYQRAAKLIDQMEEKNIIGPYEGTKPRQVIITRQEFNEMKYNQSHD